MLMKSPKTILFLILSMLLTAGCSNTEKIDNTTETKNPTLTQSSASTDLETTQSESDVTLEKTTQSDSIENNREQYNLLDLSIGDDEQKVIDLYGEPEAIDREVIGDYILTDQCLYTYMIYNDKTITIRKYFDESNSYDSQNGIIEMDIHDGDCETNEGIHIGSSIDDVINKYNIKQIYDKENDGGDLDVPKAIWARTNNSGSIRHNSEYGEFEKIAYIQSGIKFEDHNNIPALIFLIHDDKVSHIIVMNTVQYTLS